MLTNPITFTIKNLSALSITDFILFDRDGKGIIQQLEPKNCQSCPKIEVKGLELNNGIEIYTYEQIIEECIRQQIFIEEIYITVIYGSISGAHQTLKYYDDQIKTDPGHWYRYLPPMPNISDGLKAWYLFNNTLKQSSKLLLDICAGTCLLIQFKTKQ